MRAADGLVDDVVIIGGLLAALYFFGQQAAGAVVTAAGNTAAGVIVGIGQQIGIPATNVQQCQAAVDSSDWWNASFQCPAGTFLKSIF